MEKLHPLMFVGTGSDVGKSILTAAFCRIFKQEWMAVLRSKEMENEPLLSPVMPITEIGRAHV